MRIERFEDVIAWQKAQDLNINLRQIFDKNRDYSFKDQAFRAAVSVMNNIAEGFDRNSDREFRHFLYIAKGSVAEIRSMLSLARELNYIDEHQYYINEALSVEISKILAGFIKSLN